METWLKIASKCPVCSASTCITQIKGPLYFSSHRDGLKGKSNAELELLLLEITRKRQRDKDCLRESRIANKYLTGELKKYKRIIQTPQVTAQEAEVNYLKMLYWYRYLRCKIIKLNYSCIILVSCKKPKNVLNQKMLNFLRLKGNILL